MREQEYKILSSKIRGCRKCDLCNWQPVGGGPVAGDGSIDSSYMIIGEAPGENESVSGLPFVGAAGKMLDTLLDKASLKRDMFYITNIVKCRPTSDRKKNRAPTQGEIDACKIHLWNEMQLVKPKYIFTLGKLPTYLLLSNQLKKSFKLTDVIGKKYTVTYSTAEIVPNLHPSYIMQYGKKWIQPAADIFGKTING